MLNLRVISPKGIKSSLTISPSSSIYDLRIKICEIFDVRDVSSIVMLYKFPPQVLELEDNVILTNNIENNETIRLQLKENSQVQMQGSPPKSTSKGKKKVTNQNETKSHSFGFGARIASLEDGKIVHEKRQIDNAINDKKKKQKPSGNYWDKLVQNALKDSEAADNRVKPRVRVTRGSSASNEGDISEHLIAAASGEMNTRGKNFRKAFKIAVDIHYAWTLSVQRLGALYSGHYSIEECENTRILGSGASTTLKIKFQKSVKKYHEEECQLVPIPLLKSILESALNDDEGNGREFLKPANMARATKQIFWSMVKHYGADIPRTLKTLFPHINDWAWLTERTRELSEKAKRNLEQQRQLAEEKSRRSHKKGKDGVSNLDAVDFTNTNADDTNMNSTAATTTTTTDIINSNKMNPELINAFEGCGTLEPIVPEEWLEKVKKVIGCSEDDMQSNHVLLLASYTGESLNNKSYLENLVEAIRQLDDGKLAPSLEQVDSWMAMSQSCIVKAYWSLVCGSNYRLWYAIRYHLLTVSPIQMKVWIKNPERFYESLLASDPDLQNITLKNPFKSTTINSSSSSSSSSYFITDDPPGTNPILYKPSLKSSSFFITDDPVAFLQKPTPSSQANVTSASIPLDSREYVILNLEWVVWMCNITEQILKIGWLEYYDGTLDDENEDTDDNNDDNNENNIDDDGWLYELTDNRYIGKRVRINVEDNFFQEAKIIAYLPPTDEDEPLWRAELDSFSKSKKKKFEDLDQADLSTALM